MFTRSLKEDWSRQYFSEFVASVIRRLEYVEETDKEEYLKDFIKYNKESNMVNLIVNQQTKERIYETPLDIITVAATKPT